MRYIRKGPEPLELIEHKAAANDDWKPTYANFGEKPAVRKALAVEQGYLCGYCGSRVGERDGDCHIEHLNPQKTHPELQLAYGNMLASCMASDKKPPTPEHCGAARGTKPVPVSPYNQDCADFFEFGSDGSIRPSSDPTKAKAAKDTIENLRLDIRRLTAARQAAIDGALQGLDDQPPDVLRAEAAQYVRTDASGRLPSFCFAIEQVLLREAALSVPGTTSDTLTRER